MKNLIVKEFNGSQIYTFMWKEKSCWIANQIVGLFDYADVSKTIQDCIKAEDFEIEQEYDVLKGNEFNDFVTTLNVVANNIISNKARSITIFYEDGLYGFLQYTDKPIGVQFRKWLRREVLPSIRQTGAYITNNANPEKLREKASEIEKLQLAYNSTSMLKELLDGAGFDNKSKLLTAKTLYKKAGIDLPIEINEEEHYFDTKQIASKLKIYSKSNKPAQLADCEIIKKIDLEENEVKGVWETNGSWTGTVNKYTKSVIDKVRNWIEENNRPTKIAGEKKNYHVVYKIE